MTFHQVARPSAAIAPAEIVAAATCPPIITELFPGAETAQDVLFIAELTGRCNLRCTHCYADAGPRVRDDAFMTPQRWMAAFRWAWERGYRNLQLIGGEPMLHPAFPELLAFGTGLGFAVEVFSNGTVSRRPARDALLRSAPRMAFSLYGASAEVHDRVTKAEGSFRRTVDTVAWCGENGLTTRIAFIDTGVAPGEFERARALLAGLGAADVQRYDVRPVGRGQDIAPATRPGHCGLCGQGMVCLTPSGEFFPCAFGRHRPLGRIGEGAYAELALA